MGTAGQRTRQGAVCAAALLAVLGLGSAASAAPVTPDLQPLHVVDLGTLGGATSTAAAVNDSGHVVGVSQIATGQSHAFLWRNGHMTDLGSPPGAGISLATGVNDNGEIVGQLGNAPNGLPGGFVWRDGTMRVIGGSGLTQPTGVNAAGDICAYFQTAPGADTDAALLVFGHRVIVRHDAVANAVNDFGAVAGWFDNGNGPTAYLWHLTTGRFVPLGHFPDAPTGATQAFGVNNRRQVAGAADVPDPQSGTVLRAVIWTTDNRPHLLPGFASRDNFAQANDVNNVGQLAGLAGVRVDGQPTVHAVLWTS